jgi:predicted amidohydrolase YtcJ
MKTSSRRAVLVFASFALLGACAPASREKVSDLVLRDGAIYTMDDVRSRAEAIAISRGEIVFVGTNTGVERYVGPSTRVISLEGKMVLPGFHDAHVHPVTSGIELGQCNLSGLPTQDAVLKAILDCVPDGEWIVGGGWDLTLFPEGNPQSTTLDAVVPDRPVYLSSADVHSAWVNSRALELAGISAATPDPPNGRIERDPNTKKPSGTLRESATALVSRHLPPLALNDYVEGLRRGLAVANRFGITSLVETTGTSPIVDAYASLEHDGGLTARVRIALAVDEAKDESQIDSLVVTRRRFPGPFLRADAVKIFADGVIESRTAALLEPYLGLDHRGASNYEPERLARMVARLDREGFQAHVHAIGDRAIRETLDAIEQARKENGPRDSRHQIAHLELFDPVDIPRFRALGVVANFQPLWAYADTYITELTEPVLGPSRSRWLYPIRSVADSGAVLAAGSDWSVSSMNPLDGMEVAITRRGIDAIDREAWIPEERVDLETILTAYTRGGAYAMHQERWVGSLEAGKRADIIVLDRDLFRLAPEEIHRARVLWTLLDGKEVFRDESFRSR